MRKVLQHIRSVCPDCRCKGQIVADNGNLNLCTKCQGKGYQTYDELLSEIDETEELGDAQRQEKKEKQQRQKR